MCASVRVCVYVCVCLCVNESERVHGMCAQTC